MNYLGFFCVGVGILMTALGLLCLAISLFSKETIVRKKAQFFAMCILPVALILLGVGGYLVFSQIPA